MMSGFGGSLEKLKSSIDVPVTSIGEALAPTIQKVTEFIQGLTHNTCTHLGLEDAAEEMRRMEEAENARREQEKLAGKALQTQKMFRIV